MAQVTPDEEALVSDEEYRYEPVGKTDRTRTSGPSLELALRRLPNEKELPVLLTNMSSLGKKSGLEIRYFRPAEEINRGFYAEVPIHIEFVGRIGVIGVAALSSPRATKVARARPVR